MSDKAYEHAIPEQGGDKRHGDKLENVLATTSAEDSSAPTEASPLQNHAAQPSADSGGGGGDDSTLQGTDGKLIP